MAKHKTSGIQIPSKPDWMNDSDYKHAINDEVRTGDGGDNIHAGLMPITIHPEECL